MGLSTEGRTGGFAEAGNFFLSSQEAIGFCGRSRLHSRVRSATGVGKFLGELRSSETGRQVYN
jgi:hypothetical protein